MNAAKFESWIKESGATDRENRHYNGIDYIFFKLPDGWIAILEYDEGEYIPMIQARDMPHAESYCVRRERLNVPAAKI